MELFPPALEVWVRDVRMACQRDEDLLARIIEHSRVNVEKSLILF
jgi:hypothetical protein